MSFLPQLSTGNSVAYAINNRGQIVGFSFTSNGEGHAVLWDGGTAIDLGTLGGHSSTALAINDRGDIAGLGTTGPNEFSPAHALLWTK
jgi:probable HAF family extracellular repeat protein